MGMKEVTFVVEQAIKHEIEMIANNWNSKDLNTHGTLFTIAHNPNFRINYTYYQDGFQLKVEVK